MPSSTEPLRVVHLINHLGRGGTERQLYLLLRHLDRERFRHRVVVFNPSRNAVWDAPLAALGVEVESLPPSCRGVPRRLIHLFRRLRSFRPDVIHSWTVHDNPYAGLLARFLGASSLGSLRGSLHTPGLARLSRLSRWLMLRSVDGLLANCRALAAELAAAGVEPRRVVVLPNAVEIPADLTPADLSEHGIPAGAPVVATVGNLRRIKRHELFIEAMAEVLPRHREARALIVGQPVASEPGYPDELGAAIRRHGLADRVILTGFRADVPEILARFDILCLTSESEGMPNAVLEAMAAGRPVVAMGVGGVPEIIVDGETGHVVPPGDVGALARAVDGLLADPERAAAMGVAGRRRVAIEHDPARLAGRLGELYEPKEAIAA